MKTLSLAEVRGLTDRISYKGWWFVVGEMGHGFYLQWRWMETNNTDPSDTRLHEQGGRKWYVSPYATPSEVVNTAFLAAKVAETHELMERFRVDGKTLYNPHQDVFALLALELPEDARQNLEYSRPEGSQE